MASSSKNDLKKVGNEAFAFLSDFRLRKGKASPSPKLVPVQNGSENKENSIDAYQAARMYGGHLFTTYPTQIKTVERPMAKASVHNVYQHYYKYQRSGA